jgi:hypothetical protein
MNSNALHDCLRRLLPHVDTARIALTGGVAIGLHLERAEGDQTRCLAADDVDFVSDDIEAVRDTVTSEFLVSHFHEPAPGYSKFLIQLVDPVERLRLDIFPAMLGALERASVVDVGGVSLRVLTAPDILDHKLALLSGASTASPVDEKHCADARRLGILCGRQVPPFPASHFTMPSYSREVEKSCPRCQASQRAGFTLAPKTTIVDILGYV